MPDTLYEKQELVVSNVGSIGSTWWRFQSFTPSVSHQITSVDLNAIRTGTPGTLIVDIYGVDGGGDPDVSGGVLASGTYNGDSISTVSSEWFNVLVSGAGDSLLASTQYAIVMRLQNEGLGFSHLLGFYGKGTTDPYAGGLSGRNTTSGVGAWTQFANDDFAFREYGIAPPPTKDVTAGAIIAKNDVLKTVTSGSIIAKDGETKTVTAGANIIKGKQVAVAGLIRQDTVLKTVTTGAIVAKDGLTKTVTVQANIANDPDDTWPQGRPIGYDPDKMWDEETKSWYAPESSIGVERMAQAGGRQIAKLVALSDQGQIYFSEF